MRCIKSILGDVSEYKSYKIIIGRNGCISSSLINELKGIEMVHMVDVSDNMMNLSYALNFLIDYSEKIYKPDLYFRMDPDDLWCKGRINNQMLIMDGNKNIDILGGGAIFIDESSNELYASVDEILPKQFQSKLIISSCMIHPTVVFRSRCFRELGLRYDDTLIRGQDWGLWRSAQSKNAVIYKDSKPVIYYKFTYSAWCRRFGFGVNKDNFIKSINAVFEYRKFHYIFPVLAVFIFKSIPFFKMHIFYDMYVKMKRKNTE